MADAICKPAGRGFKDLDGLRFGRWLVLGYAGLNKHGTSTWNCRCDCGHEKVVLGQALSRGASQSCGCLHREMFKAMQPARTHGQCYSFEYRVWAGMMQRCYNPNVKAYPHYGGRGITVCERWRTVENFLADMGKAPSHDLTIDRLDNNRGYEPGNCEWRTYKQQNRNYSRNRVYEFRGVKMCVTDIAEKCGLPGDVVTQRIRRGWSLDRAISTPLKRIAPK